MTIIENIEAQKTFRKHCELLGPQEVRRRGALLNQAENLITQMLKRAKALPAFENDHRRRLIDLTMKACHRSDRRAKAYYGQ